MEKQNIFQYLLHSAYAAQAGKSGLFLILFLPFFALAAQNNVVINEVAWMGTSASTANEWIELYNGSGGDVDLNGWILEAQDSSPRIKLSGVIPSKRFFLLERTDDETVSGISADIIYTGALSNDGEILSLKTMNGEEVDRVDATKGWQAGDAKSKETMQRDGEAWLTAEATPRRANHFLPSSSPSVPLYFNPPTLEEQILEETPSLPILRQEEEKVSLPPEIVSAKEFSVKPEPIRIVSGDALWSNVLINEFFPNPSGSDETGEWIELYNDGAKDVVLAGMLLDDDEGGSRPYTIPQGTSIPPKGFFVFPRLETRIALNTSNDAVRLLTSQKQVLARVMYDKAKEDEAAAYDLEKRGFFWTKQVTKGKQNEFSESIQVNDKGVLIHQDNIVASLDTLPDIDVKELGARPSLPLQKEEKRNRAWLLGSALLLGTGFFALWRVRRKSLI